MGPLIPPFSPYDDICPGFQSQVGSTYVWFFVTLMRCIPHNHLSNFSTWWPFLGQHGRPIPFRTYYSALTRDKFELFQCWTWARRRSSHSRCRRGSGRTRGAPRRPLPSSTSRTSRAATSPLPPASAAATSSPTSCAPYSSGRTS